MLRSVTLGASLCPTLVIKRGQGTTSVKGWIEELGFSTRRLHTCDTLQADDYFHYHAKTYFVLPYQENKHCCWYDLIEVPLLNQTLELMQSNTTTDPYFNSEEQTDWTLTGLSVEGKLQPLDRQSFERFNDHAQMIAGQNSRETILECFCPRQDFAPHDHFRIGGKEYEVVGIKAWEFHEDMLVKEVRV